MRPEAFQSAISALQSGNPPRVWSLIVTVFGDLARDEGEAISGPVLADILTPLGIKPEAMRVALHRLRNEGWLVAQKQGRTSLHVLAKYGQVESQRASDRIYRRAHPAGEHWHILCQQHAGELPPGYIQIAPGVGLSNTSAPQTDGNDFVFEGRLQKIPPWVMISSLPKGVLSDMRDLDAAMDFVLKELDNSAPPSALQSACLRAAIVHHWRRLILKVPDVPDDLFGETWIGLTCRTKVHDALERLQRPKMSDLG